MEKNIKYLGLELSLKLSKQEPQTKFIFKRRVGIDERLNERNAVI
jgi:hypothetical protein